MKHLKIEGKFEDGRNSVEMSLPVMLFEEDGLQIAYIPMLDVSGYGKDEPEAINSLKIAIEEYFTYTIRKNTLIEDLLTRS